MPSIARSKYAVVGIMEVVVHRSVVAAVALALVLGGFAVGGTGLGASPKPPVKRITITGSSCTGGHFFCYKPAALKIKKGTKVIWTNTDWVDHTVTRCSKAKCGVDGGTGKQTKFASPSIGHSKTYAFTFSAVGTYRYYCKPHGYASMHGTITVTP